MSANQETAHQLQAGFVVPYGQAQSMLPRVVQLSFPIPDARFLMNKIFGQWQL
jgi:hypothetical protein